MCFRFNYEEKKKKNCEGKVHKVEEILSNWGDKRFNLICKIAFMKALAASPLVYVIRNAPFLKFLWDYKGHNVKRTESMVYYDQDDKTTYNLKLCLLYTSPSPRDA